MARAIDADELKKSLIGVDIESDMDVVFADTYDQTNLFEIIDKAPTIDPVKQEWISVKDRLPERTLPPHDVLVYHDLNCGMFVDRAWYSYDMGKWCSVLGMKLKVTHWMPMPEPPERDDE